VTESGTTELIRFNYSLEEAGKHMGSEMGPGLLRRRNKKRMEGRPGA